MGKYIKLFETHSDYEAFTATSDFILPNVSYCEDRTDEVHYNPYVDPCKQYDYVEIGGVKWATKNVGACDITDTGLYFQWGDTQGYTAEQCGSGEGQKYFGWADYKYGNGTSSPVATDITKYNATDGKTVLETIDDAVIANLGGGWRMPTYNDFATLSNTTTNEWVANYQGSGVNGILFTSIADSNVKLFFPACGSCYNGSVNNVSSYGFYWSNLLRGSGSDYMTAYILYSANGGFMMEESQRCCGCPVRGVFGQNS